MPTKTGLKWSSGTFLHNISYFAVQNMFIKPRLGSFDEQASWKSRKAEATIPTWWRAGVWTGLLCSQLFHLPLTLDMDGCGWSGTHLSLALLHTHCFLFHTHHFSHTFGFEPWACSCTSETRKYLFDALLNAASWTQQSSSLIKHQLFSLIRHSKPVTFRLQSEISCHSFHLRGCGLRSMGYSWHWDSGVWP